MSTPEDSPAANTRVVEVYDWKPRGVWHTIGISSGCFVGLMEDGCSVLKYPHHPNDPETMKALRDEAYCYRSIGPHENLVTFKHMSDDGLVLEFCENGSLCDVIGSLDEGLKIAIGEQVARGLVHLHTQNYIHSDLNTRNVFVTSDWTAKIGDLQGQLKDSDGNVKVRPIAENDAKSRLPGLGLDDDASTQEDIFAFGTLLYHVWYGHPPYPELDPYVHDDEVEITARYSRGEFPVDAHAVGLEKVIWRCWNSKYTSASEILDDISSLDRPECSRDLSQRRPTFEENTCLLHQNLRYHPNTLRRNFFAELPYDDLWNEAPAQAVA
jgi:serine/threonine protein kinase